jgi:hypothetical protein
LSFGRDKIFIERKELNGGLRRAVSFSSCGSILPGSSLARTTSTSAGTLDAVAERSDLAKELP